MSNGTLLAPGQSGFGKARIVSTPCFYIFMPIQNVPFWAGLSQASSLVSKLADWGEGNPFEKGEFWAELQQLKQPNAVLKDGVKGGAAVGRCGGLLGCQFGHRDGKATRTSWLPALLGSCPPLPVLLPTIPIPLRLNEWKSSNGN